MGSLEDLHEATNRLQIKYTYFISDYNPGIKTLKSFTGIDVEQYNEKNYDKDGIIKVSFTNQETGEKSETFEVDLYDIAGIPNVKKVTNQFINANLKPISFDENNMPYTPTIMDYNELRVNIANFIALTNLMLKKHDYMKGIDLEIDSFDFKAYGQDLKIHLNRLTDMTDKNYSANSSHNLFFKVTIETPNGKMFDSFSRTYESYETENDSHGAFTHVTNKDLYAQLHDNYLEIESNNLLEEMKEFEAEIAGHNTVGELSSRDFLRRDDMKEPTNDLVLENTEEMVHTPAMSTPQYKKPDLNDEFDFR